jgi:hypothetical protein
VPQASAADKKMRCILIFDDHPDSLRLVFGGRADSHVHPSGLQSLTSSRVALLRNLADPLKFSSRRRLVCYGGSTLPSITPKREWA